MSRKGTIDVFQTKTTRNDRFAQMSHQEKLIEQKKKEIQAKLEQKQKNGNSSSDKSDGKSKESVKQDVKSYNQFSNDGSFLDQFKQMKDKKMDQKLKSFKFSQEKSHSEDRNRNSNRWAQRRRSPSPTTSRHKFSRFPDKTQNEPKISISTSYSNLISQANFNVQTPPQVSITPENIVGQPLLKNEVSPPTIAFPSPTQTSTTVISALPVMLNVPPPQVIQQTPTMPVIVQQPALPTTAVVSSIPNTNPELPTATIITSLNLPPPTPTIGPQNAPLASSLSVLSPEASISNSLAVPALSSITSVELASIPPPNPIQLQNIPQPEPINTMNIPPPAPLQVQNIPQPSPIQLNEIPKPKPIDIINIPTPTEVPSAVEKSMSDPDFIKNIPPPNKSVPPPSLQDTTINANISVPPPNPGLPSISTPAPTCMPPPNVSLSLSSQNIPPPPSLTLQSQNVPSTVIPPQSQNIPPPHALPPPPPPQSLPSLIIPQNISENVPSQVVTSQTIIVHSVPPQNLGAQNVQSLQLVPQSTTIQTMPPQLSLQQAAQTLPPGNSAIPATLTLQSANPGATLTTASAGTNVIISQQLLPPNQGQMGVAAPNLNVHCPPPIVSNNIQGLQQTFINQPPPISTHMPPMNMPPPPAVSNALPTPPQDIKNLFNTGTAEYEAMASLGRMVAQCGPGIEDVVRQRKQQDPNLWFLFHKESAAYQQYQQLIQQFKNEMENEVKNEADGEEKADSDSFLIKREKSDGISKSSGDKDNDQEGGLCKRKRRSRWGDKEVNIPPPAVVLTANASVIVPPNAPIVRPATSPIVLTKISRNDPGLLQYIMQTYGTTDLTEEDWKKAEDNFKVSLLYQEMLRKKQEAEKLAKAGKHKYEYDSDEETEGGTWEHKLREKEMQKTQQWATELTKNAEGKHHIGDFLPPEELQKFLEKNKTNKQSGDSSDYKDFKIKDDNIGFKMLQKLGWSEGQGLGANASGIVDPVNKAPIRDQNQGLGLAPAAADENDDEYESYRKRMMLAYRFRPNPLNNPRRPYY